MNCSDLQPLSLSLGVVLAAVVVLLADLALPASPSPRLGWLTVLLLTALLGASFVLPLQGVVTGGVWVGSAWSTFLGRLFLVAGMLASLGGLHYVARVWQYRQGEFYVLLLLSLAGMVLLPGARDLVLFIVAFELMGIPLYILSAFAKHDAGKKPVEAALKFYLVGAGSTALTFFGAALLAGIAGSTDLAKLAAGTWTPLHTVGALLMIAGMGFKIGAAPFHSWVPDAYEGAPTPVVAFLSVAPKVAGFAALIVLLMVGLGRVHGAWTPIVTLISVTTLVIGNLLAIPQRNVKRLLAYSGVAQVGYILMGLLAGGQMGPAMALFYLASYVLTNLGIFLVVHAIAEAGDGEDIAAFDGLARRSPWLAMALLLFLLSLAGIPFVSGFWAKFYVFMAAWQAGYGWLVLTGALLATVALFYYLGVARAAYVNKPRKDGAIVVSPALTAAIVACLLGVVGLGAWPAALVDAALLAVRL